MLAKCANPACIRPFLRLSEGKLFWQEVIRASAEGNGLDRQLVWFCDACILASAPQTQFAASTFQPVFRAERRPRSQTQQRAS